MKSIIIANWKCNPVEEKEAINLFESVKKGVKNIKNTHIVICPPFVYMPRFKGVDMGSQDVFFEEKGAYTGEISSLMLKDLGCKYAIIGHSERRKYFNETDDLVNKKIKSALKSGLIPIFCVGETEKERKNKETEKVVKRQIKKGLEGILSSMLNNLIIAYEPVWAIGTGNSCDTAEARKMNLFIKKILSDNCNPQLSEKTYILYGGSVNSSNAMGYIKEAEMNGLLVGGASLDSNEFIKIAKSAA